MNWLINLIHYVFFFLISYQEEFQIVKYKLSRISTSRQSSQHCKIQFFSLFGWFFKILPKKTCVTFKMFLLSAQNNYIILSSYVKSEVYVFSWFPGLQNLDISGKLNLELVWKSFSGRNNYLEPPHVFWFSSSRLCGLEKSIKRVGSLN